MLCAGVPEIYRIAVTPRPVAPPAQLPLPPGEVGHRLDRRGLSLLSTATERAHAPDSAAHDRPSHLAAVQGERRTGARATPQLQRALGECRGRASSTSAPQAAADAAGVRGAARQRRATSRTTRSPISTSISRPTRRRSRRPAAHVHCAATAEEARERHPRHLPQAPARETVTKGKSMIAEEIGLNDHLEAARHRAGRDRSRRIHHPAPRRDAVATSSRRRCTSTRTQVEADFRRVHTHLDRRARPRPSRCSCSPRRAACCASASSPPMSASPAPISSSPRPAPRSSSPTRATAT